MVWVHLLSVTVGLVLGGLGGGGAILAMPILLYVGHLSPRSAIATSLAVVGSTALVGALRHSRSGNVRWKEGLYFATAGMAGAFVGAKVAQLIPARGLILGFAALMLVAAVFMARPVRTEPRGAPHPGWILPLGVVLGSITGAVGAGGGFVIVPALTLLMGMSMRHAVGTSLLVIALQSFAGLMGHLDEGVVDPMLALTTSLAAVAGMFAGTALAGKLPQQRLRQAFAGLMVVAGLYIGAREVVGLTQPPATAPAAVISTPTRATVGAAR